MATVDSSAAAQAIDIGGGTVEIGTITSSLPGEFVYTAVDGTTTVRIAGAFTYDANGIPITGAVTSISLDLGSNGSNDIHISNFDTNPSITDLITNYTAAGYANPNTQEEAGEDFYAVAFGEADTFTGSNFSSPQGYYGDFLEVDAGEVVVTAADTFAFPLITAPFARFYADGLKVNGGTVTGGADLFDFADGNQAPGTLHFDVFEVDAGGVLNGGDDLMNIAADATINGQLDLTIFGDAQIVKNGSTLVGGDDTIINTTGTELAVYGDAHTIESGAVFTGGNDTITSFQGSFNLPDFFEDVLIGDVMTIDGNATFTGGDDTINGGASADIIYGDYQTLVSGTIVAGGDDILNGGVGDDMIVGNEGDDTIDGGNDDDTVDGGAGDDTIKASAGFDTIDGGADSDWFDLSTSTTGANWVSLTAAGSQFRVNEGAGYIGRATLANVENVFDSAGVDAFYGNAEDNSYRYTSGLDTFDGNGGTDTLDISQMTAGFQWINLTAPSSQLRSNDGSGWVANMILSDIENFITTDDTDHFYGDATNSTVVYRGDRDFVNGGAGLDTIDMSVSGVGAWMNLNIAFDQFRFFNGVGWQSAGNLVDVEGMIGTVGNDFFYGNAENNRFFGGLGNDRFEAGAGSDVFVLDGQQSDYTVTESGGVYTVTGISGTDTLIDVEFLEIGGVGFAIDSLLGSLTVSDLTVETVSSLELPAAEGGYLPADPVQTLQDLNLGGGYLADVVASSEEELSLFGQGYLPDGTDEIIEEDNDAAWYTDPETEECDPDADETMDEDELSAWYNPVEDDTGY